VTSRTVFADGPAAQLEVARLRRAGNHVTCVGALECARAVLLGLMVIF
jgi:hypothetical protein